MHAIKRRALPLAAAAVLLFGVGAYAGAAAPAAVTIANFAFSPTPLTVAGRQHHVPAHHAALAHH